VTVFTVNLMSGKSLILFDEEQMAVVVGAWGVDPHYRVASTCDPCRKRPHDSHGFESVNERDERLRSRHLARPELV
jgi:hypothetical protein